MRNMVLFVLFLTAFQFAVSSCASSRSEQLSQHQAKVHNNWLEKKTYWRGIASEEEVEDKGKYYYGK